MIVSLDVRCPYCGRSDHAFDAETGAIHLDPDTQADGKPCAHLVYGMYQSYGGRGYTDAPPNPVNPASYHSHQNAFAWLCPALSTFAETDTDFLDWIAENMYAGNMSPTITTPYEISEPNDEFFAGKRVNPYDHMDDDDGIEEDDAEVIGGGGGLRIWPHPEGDEALPNDTKAGNVVGTREKPIVPQDIQITVSSCVLWSVDPEELVQEMRVQFME
jgi:hypothetical protein